MQVHLATISPGWHDACVFVKVGSQEFSSDTIRIYCIPKAAEPARATEVEVAAMHDFFADPFNDFIIANYNSYIYSRRGQTSRDTAYRATWERVLQSDIPEDLKAPIKLYIEKAQRYIDGDESIAKGEINLPIDLLNESLLGLGQPFYAYLYYKHFPIVCAITDTLTVVLDKRRYPVFLLEQVSRIAGGWTPTTLYGHARASYAVLHDELHRSKSDAMYACLQEEYDACTDFFNFAVQKLPPSQQATIVAALRKELKEYFAALPETLNRASLHALHLRSTAVHEALHLEERFLGTDVAQSIVYLVEGFHIRPRNRDNRQHVVHAQHRKAVNLRGQSLEYNAYLTELVYSQGLKRQILLHLYNNAQSDYEARMILANLGKKAKIWRNYELVYKNWDRNVDAWTDLLLELLALPINDLQDILDRLYLEDFGRMRHVRVE